MEFPSFPRIGTHPATVTRGPWLATEKVHGAQLVLEAGRAVRFGKRKAWLADAEPFFGWQLLRASLTEAALMIRAAVGEDVIYEPRLEQRLRDGFEGGVGFAQEGDAVVERTKCSRN